MASESNSNDIFDCIVMAEQTFHGEGYQEGFEKGTARGLQTGRRHGASHGAKLSTEISFYYGFAITWKSLLQHRTEPKLKKRLKVVESLLGLIQNSSLEDPKSEKLKEGMEKLRSKFKQVCSVLGLQTDFKDYTKTTDGASF
ncbi:protein LTO1 homolog [Corythoichthys intestinalis]|uniref:protein LTO1 homolog n=1 Tax=Corythoichthys intestinalis TaxID=161448 RepID=UPI0025A59BF7|nr:protein LTO1 homolog [Corythoichthys intestinalis]XP_061810531.1 protein LTO1 homolog [Nerophis lumbriciformis]